jgi:hypothetical protein
MIVDDERESKNFFDYQELLKSVREANSLQQEVLKSKISKEDAEIILRRLSQGMTEETALIENLTVSLSKSKKPLWIDVVKKTCESIIPEVDMRDLEITKDILVKEDSEDLFVSPEDYPYYTTIKKLQYAFGDVYKTSQRTVIYLHEFLKRFLITLAKILNECDFKKTFEHLYSYEFSKFYNYKKLKFKNTFEEPPKEGEKEEDLSETENFGFVVEQALNCDEEETIKEQSQIKRKNYLETIFEEKDDNYFENLAFQDQRTSSMSHPEYLDFISCRHQTFLSKGKKTFINFLQSILQSSFPYDLKDANNLEVVSYLCKEILRKIITDAIRTKHSERKLFVLNFPLIVEDLEELCNYEVEKLESFMNDYYSDTYLMKELKKKKAMKLYNKNVKIKKSDLSFTIIIKKLVFLQDSNQSDFLRKNKKKSEDNAMNIKNVLVNIYNDFYKSFDSKQSESTQTRKSKKKKKEELNDTNLIMNNIPAFNYQDFVAELKLSNYYEYFLISPFMIENLESKYKSSFLDKSVCEAFKSEISSKVSLIKKTSKKTFSDKFNIWLEMTNSERNFIVDEYNKLMNCNNMFYNDEESN